MVRKGGSANLALDSTPPGDVKVDDPYEDRRELCQLVQVSQNT